MKSLTLVEIAKLTKGSVIGNAEHLIRNVADLESATEHDISFYANPRYEQAFRRSTAGAVFVPSSFKADDNRNYLVVDDPSLAFQQLVNHFYNKQDAETGFSGIHATAVIHPTAKIHEKVTIGPYVVVDRNVTIGARTKIGSHVVIGASTNIGEDCIIHPHVTIRELSQIGNRVILQPGCVIGSCGYGYITNKQGQHIKLEQVGNVTLEDDVEIGANTTIDRSRFKTTKISRGSKIDNQVQIAHGVIVGEDNLIVSQAGIAGSTTTGRHVVLGGQVGIIGHIHISDGVMVAAGSGVSKSLTKAGKYNGIPAIPLDEYNRMTVYLRNIERYVEKIKSLEKRINELEDT